MLDRIGVDRQAAGTWDAERELSGAELPERRPARRGPTEVRADGAVNLRQSSAAVRTWSDQPGHPSMIWSKKTDDTSWRAGQRPCRACCDAKGCAAIGTINKLLSCQAAASWRFEPSSTSLRSAS